jgi:hypothetical protein
VGIRGIDGFKFNWYILKSILGENEEDEGWRLGEEQRQCKS